MPARWLSRAAGRWLAGPAFGSTTTSPSITTEPMPSARTMRGMRPAAARVSVDLPAPFGPATVTNEPASTATDTSRRASSSRPKYRTRRSLMSSAGPALTTRASATDKPDEAKAGDDRQGQKQERGNGRNPAILDRGDDDAVGRPRRPRRKCTRLERERALADVDQRTDDHRPEQRHHRPDTGRGRAGGRKTAGLLGLEDPARLVEHPWDRLDRREHDEGELGIRPSLDEGLHQVVRAGGHDERDGHAECRECAPRDREPEPEALAREGDGTDLEQDLVAVGVEKAVDQDDRQ